MISSELLKISISRNIRILLILIGSFGVNPFGLAQKREQVIDKVWAGHRVGFDFHTSEKFQYACYYNAERDMVIAQRKLDSQEWKRTILPTKIGWDSHNYVTMAIDKNGFVHVSGNMHNVPMIYFRSQKPEDISTFDKLPMTSENENRATYPVFFKDQSGELYFQYRNGGSGDGITYWNKYNSDSKSWKGLFDTPIFDGEGESNAYMSNPKLGPDGYFYVVWMWRLTPTANTNHNLSCIRSKDLVHWENQRGDAISVPIKWHDNMPTVDPVGPWNGLINTGFQVSWDQENTPYITYHKFDSKGISQGYVARWDPASKDWVSYQVSQWKAFTWDLNRRGSLGNAVNISGIKIVSANELSIHYNHEKYGKGTWFLDKKTLVLKREIQDPAHPKEGLSKLPKSEQLSSQSKMDNTGKYILEWQTLPSNQDLPREPPYPQPTELTWRLVSTK